MHARYIHLIHRQTLRRLNIHTYYLKSYLRLADGCTTPCSSVVRLLLVYYQDPIDRLLLEERREMLLCHKLNTVYAVNSNTLLLYSLSLCRLLITQAITAMTVAADTRFPHSLFQQPNASSCKRCFPVIFLV